MRTHICTKCRCAARRWEKFALLSVNVIWLGLDLFPQFTFSFHIIFVLFLIVVGILLRDFAAVEQTLDEE